MSYEFNRGYAAGLQAAIDAAIGVVLRARDGGAPRAQARLADAVVAELRALAASRGVDLEPAQAAGDEPAQGAAVAAVLGGPRWLAFLDVGYREIAPRLTLPGPDAWALEIPADCAWLAVFASAAGDDWLGRFTPDEIGGRAGATLMLSRWPTLRASRA